MDAEFISKKKHLSQLERVAAETNAILRLSRNEIEVKLVSAAPLSESDRVGWTGVVENLTKRKPIVSFEVDPALVFGVTFEADYKFYDYSFKPLIEKWRISMLETLNKHFDAQK